MSSLHSRTQRSNNASDTTGSTGFQNFGHGFRLSSTSHHSAAPARTPVILPKQAQLTALFNQMDINGPRRQCALLQRSAVGVLNDVRDDGAVGSKGLGFSEVDMASKQLWPHMHMSSQARILAFNSADADKTGLIHMREFRKFLRLYAFFHDLCAVMTPAPPARPAGSLRMCPLPGR